MLDADVIGVQWHPEMLTEPDPLFDWIVDRATATTQRTHARQDVARAIA